MGMKTSMRRRMIIVTVVTASALCIGLIALIRPPGPAGNFPAAFSDAEKRQVVSAAYSDALRQTLEAIGRGQFNEAQRWLINSRRQTVRSVGRQGGGIWVEFGVDEPTATDGYATWARYIMTQENGCWVIAKPLF